MDGRRDRSERRSLDGTAMGRRISRGLIMDRMLCQVDSDACEAIIVKIAPKVMI